jgi:hypothetical protein
MPAQGRKATTTSVAAPIGGWNARDSVAEMNPMDAVVMQNLFPTPSEVGQSIQQALLVKFNL